jgi:hypothetical protein
MAGKVDHAAFAEKFGAPLAQLDSLVAAKTVTIARLMELTPEAIDPSATLYNTTMYLMAVLLGVALVANLMVRPVAARHHAAEGADS